MRNYSPRRGCALCCWWWMNESQTHWMCVCVVSYKKKKKKHFYKHYPQLFPSNQFSLFDFVCLIISSYKKKTWALLYTFFFPKTFWSRFVDFTTMAAARSPGQVGGPACLLRGLDVAANHALHFFSFFFFFFPFVTLPIKNSFVFSSSLPLSLLRLRLNGAVAPLAPFMIRIKMPSGSLRPRGERKKKQKVCSIGCQVRPNRNTPSPPPPSHITSGHYARSKDSNEERNMFVWDFGWSVHCWPS